MFTHILFDADNTLFDFDQTERIAFAETMRAFAVPHDDALFTRYKQMNLLLWRELEQGRADRAVELVRRFERLLPDLEFSAADMNHTYQTNLVEQTVLMPVCAGAVRKALRGSCAVHRDQRRGPHTAPQAATLSHRKVFPAPVHLGGDRRV